MKVGRKSSPRVFVNAQGERQCIGCQDWFPYQPGKGRCPECIRKRDREAQARRDPRKKRDAYLRQKYGITLEDYESLLSLQDNRCAICGSEGTKTRKGTTFALAVDHCHKAGRVRGLLCQDCNSGIGSLKDDITLLQAAISYLKGVGLTKYTKAEGTARVLSPDAHKSAQDALRKQGKSSASGLSDADRDKFDESLRQSE